jgi:hypothetical protein
MHSLVESEEYRLTFALPFWNSRQSSPSVKKMLISRLTGTKECLPLHSRSETDESEKKQLKILDFFA